MKKIYIIGGCFLFLGIISFMAVNLHLNEKKVYGAITTVSLDELIVEDEKQNKYIIQKSDVDYSNEQLKVNDQIIVTFEGEILEVSPAKFKKVIAIEKKEK